MALRPIVDCVVTPVRGHDVYSKEVLGDPKPQKCAIVKISSGWKKTSVRADVSASGGAARETIADARLLFLPDVDVGQNFKVEIAGLALRVVSIIPRFSVSGRHDHNQVDLMVWGGG